MALIDYPASVVTDREKLTAIYALEEMFRIEHNLKGEEVRDKVALRASWYAFAGRPIRLGGSIFVNAIFPILRERNRLREAIRHEAMSDAEWKAEEGKDLLTVELTKQLFGDRHVEGKEASAISSDNLEMLKALKISELNAKIPPDPYENWTTYDEHDTGGEVTVAANKIEVRDMNNASDAYVRRTGMSYTVFDHLVDITPVAAVGSGQPHCFHGPSQGSETVAEFAANQDGPCTMWYETLDDYYSKDWGTGGNDSSAGGQCCTKKYLRIYRVGTTWTMKIYTDSGRTNLQDTLTYTCSALTYTQMVSVGGREYGTPGIGSSWDLENLDLQEAAVAISGSGPGLLIANGSI